MGGRKQDKQYLCIVPQILQKNCRTDVRQSANCDLGIRSIEKLSFNIKEKNLGENATTHMVLGSLSVCKTILAL